MKERVLPPPPFSKTSFMFFWLAREEEGKQAKREASRKGKQTRAPTRRRAFLVFRFAVTENLKNTFLYCRGAHPSPRLSCLSICCRGESEKRFYIVGATTNRPSLPKENLTAPMGEPFSFFLRYTGNVTRMLRFWRRCTGGGAKVCQMFVALSS